MNIRALATKKKLASDIKDIDDESVDYDTVMTYLDVFERLFLLDNQKPFSSNIRSSVRVKQTEKRHFCDPSLACALLKATPDRLISDLETFGFYLKHFAKETLEYMLNRLVLSCSIIKTMQTKKLTQSLN